MQNAKDWKRERQFPEWMGHANIILNMPSTEREPELRPTFDSVQHRHRHRQLPAIATTTCNLFMYEFETY